MADLSIYELDDIIWDDFERSGDHIVPHPTEDHGGEDKYDGDNSIKPRLEVVPLQSKEGNLDNASSSVCQFKEERESKTSNKETDVTEKDSWSHITASGDADSTKDMLKDTSGAVDRNSYNELNLFSNDHDAKESSDLLYFGWPDMGNLEDVDKILSNCDSSFGLGITGNDDELVWLTSEDPGGGYEEALKMDLKFPCSEPSALTSVSQDHQSRESDTKASGFVSGSKVEFNLKHQKKQSRQQNQTDGMKASHCLKGHGLKSNDTQISSSDKSFTLLGNWQQTKYSGHDSVGYMRSSTYLHPGHGHAPVQSTGGSIMTGIRSKIKAPSKVHSVESSSQPSFTGNHNHVGMMQQASRNDLLPSPKQFRMLENKIECQSNMEGAIKGSSAELDSFDVPESSSISSELDEISPEATTLRQLQQVMLQLDVRTKLCIRDSLYRLARSAEQRHNYAGISDKYTGLMGIETDTNPIDRTIAHLLFHRPSDSSNMPTHQPLKLNTKAHGSMACLPSVAEKQFDQQTKNESDDKIINSRKT
ncbi:hypothetical protein QVD17_27428 [Tagetes erecta]|uniref:Protein LNK1 n=1 Tax=Tagetes erecta TaxID=13708 RepID=A0AAD8KET4_TARER|nr:hypothetical protein QVD17_27428 [Tagetes erecta]